MEGAAPKPPRKRTARRALFLAFYALVTGGLLTEVLLRWRTKELASQPALMNVILLPLDPVPPKRARGLALDPADVSAMPYIIPDAVLGWTVRPNGRSRFDAGGQPVEYAANSIGLRSAPREVPREKAEGKLRILAVGDSFAHGDDLPWPLTWIARLEETLGAGFETWTGGVPGYGTDQAFLRLEQLLPAVQPEVVLLVVYRQDLLRNLTFFRALQQPLTGIPWSKPRFILDGEGLTLMNSPVIPPRDVEPTLRAYASSPLSAHDRFWLPELYRDDPRYRSRIWRFLLSKGKLDRFNEISTRSLEPGGEAVVLGGRLAQRFHDRMEEIGVRPLVVILPDNVDVPSYAPGVAPLMQAFRMELNRRRIPWLDLGPELYRSLALGETAAALFIGGDGHPNERASREIAATLARHFAR